MTKTVGTTSSIDLPGLLGEDDEHSSLLIEDPLELLVQNHLTQLLLHLHTTLSIKQCRQSTSPFCDNFIK